MGNDAFVHIVKKRYSKKMIENLLQMMDYKKCGEVFYCGNDAEYKYFSGIRVWQCDEDESEVVYWIRSRRYIIIMKPPIRIIMNTCVRIW